MKILLRQLINQTVWSIWNGSINNLTIDAFCSAVIFSIKHVDCVCLTATPNQFNTFTFTKFSFLKILGFKNYLKSIYRGLDSDEWNFNPVWALYVHLTKAALQFPTTSISCVQGSAFFVVPPCSADTNAAIKSWLG